MNATASPSAALPSRSTPGQRLWRSGTARLAAALLAAMTLAAFLGPMLMPATASELSALQFAPPSWAHPFGTDIHGQDLLYRVLTGARVSLVVGLAGAVISFTIGTAYGLVAGYAGGRIDGAMMRLVEIL
jgi:ABC-type dipeptide/oligopeptide/nickel transport system permease subunit